MRNPRLCGDAVSEPLIFVTAVAVISRSAGAAVADLPFARPACMKMSGACPATTSPGIARIAENQTVSAINKRHFSNN